MRDAIRQRAFLIYRGMPKPLQRRVARTVLPTYTLGCKVHLLDPDGLSLFVKPSYHPQWDLPSGYAKAGEAPAACAARELREETGLMVDVGEPLATVIEPASRRLDILFRVQLDHQPEARIRDTEIEQLGWGTPDETDLNPVARESLWVLDKEISLHISELR